MISFNEFIGVFEKRLQILKLEYDIDIPNKNIKVKYNDITVTNSKNDTTVLPEVYVKICFERFKDGFCIFDLKGFQNVTTYDQKKVNYIFSHLYSSGSYEFSSFCFGQGYMNNFKKTALNSEASISVFLNALKNYLSYESLEGGPYRRISSINNSSKYLRIRETPIIKWNKYINIFVNEYSEYTISNNIVAFSYKMFKPAVINGNYRLVGTQTKFDEKDNIYPTLSLLNGGNIVINDLQNLYIYYANARQTGSISYDTTLSNEKFQGKNIPIKTLKPEEGGNLNDGVFYYYLTKQLQIYVNFRFKRSLLTVQRDKLKTKKQFNDFKRVLSRNNILKLQEH